MEFLKGLFVFVKRKFHVIFHPVEAPPIGPDRSTIIDRANSPKGLASTESRTAPRHDPQLQGGLRIASIIDPNYLGFASSATRGVHWTFAASKKRRVSDATR